jgi:outer membrane protein TolC
MNKAIWFRSFLSIVLLFAPQASTLCLAQSTNEYPANSIPTPRPFDPSTNSTNPSAAATQVLNPFLGSVPEERLQPGSRSISLIQGVQLALRSNLGVIDTQLQDTSQRAARQRALSELLPHLYATASQSYALVSTIPSGGRQLALPYIVGPLSYQTVNVELSQNVFDAAATLQLQSATRESQASAMRNLDSRNVVVLAAASAYIAITATESGVRADSAALLSAQTLETLMRDRVDRNVSPQIDFIRAAVAERTTEQRLSLAQIQLAKDKLALTRIVGLSLGQQFTLSTELRYQEAPEEDLDQLLVVARANRDDLKAAARTQDAANSAVKAASARRLPTVSVLADFGGTGITPAHGYNTYDVVGTIRMPLFTGGEIAADVMDARATRARRTAEYRDLDARVEYDVRSAYLDLQGARISVSVASQNLDLAKEGLKEAQDRFDVGLANALELMQAQQAIAEAENNYISSLYAHNLAKLMLIRSTGTAERDLQAYMGGS